jgi:hypothetical protein
MSQVWKAPHPHLGPEISVPERVLELERRGEIEIQFGGTVTDGTWVAFLSGAEKFAHEAGDATIAVNVSILDWLRTDTSLKVDWHHHKSQGYRSTVTFWTKDESLTEQEKDRRVRESQGLIERPKP